MKYGMVEDKSRKLECFYDGRRSFPTYESIRLSPYQDSLFSAHICGFHSQGGGEMRKMFG